MKNYPNVTIFDHPLIGHKIAILRDKNTGTKEFRELVEEITMLMTYEAFKDAPTKEIAVVNGHSYKELKSPNTNLAILCSHNFSEPFNQPIAYAQKIGELTNMLGAGHILVQRYGDIIDGKRTWQKELARSNVRPTLPDAVAGDITAAMPYRAMINIINFIQAVDEVVPGFAAAETLLYSPELKFYSNKVKMDEDLNTSIKGLHCLGDSSGWTRGLMMASDGRHHGSETRRKRKRRINLYRRRGNALRRFYPRVIFSGGHRLLRASIRRAEGRVYATALTG